MSEQLARVQEMLKALNAKGKSAGGLEKLVQMLEKLDRGSEQNILATLKQQNPQLARELEEKFFAFEDIINLNDEVVKRALEEVHRSTLALALKGADANLIYKFIKNLSERAARMVEDDMEAMGPKPKALVAEAQQEVTKVFRRWRDVIL